MDSNIDHLGALNESTSISQHHRQAATCGDHHLTSEEKIEKQLQKLVENNDKQMHPQYMKTLSYQINDYAVNKLPEANPL